MIVIAIVILLSMMRAGHSSQAIAISSAATIPRRRVVAMFIDGQLSRRDQAPQ
jgi:hypothetical protein